MTAAEGEASEESMVELAIAGIDLGLEDARPAIGTVQLLDMATGERLEIVMARADAQAIQQAVASQDPARPRPHDLVLSAIRALGGTVLSARIVDRRAGGVFLAELVVRTVDDRELTLDARPSDALNVALRASGASLWANAALLTPALN
jgi:bifunctional DNase/RNase